MDQQTKTNDGDVRRQIILIDSRITRLQRTGKIYFQDHGIKHGGIEKLIQALMDEKRNLVNQLMRKAR